MDALTWLQRTIVCIPLAIISCAFADVPPLPDFATSPQEIDTGAKRWRFDRKSHSSTWERRIFVCWEQPDRPVANVKQLQAWAKQQIAQSWGAAAAIEFVGWETNCKPNSKGIRIAMHGYISPQAFALGRDLDGLASGIVLNVGLRRGRWMDTCRRHIAHRIKSDLRYEWCFRIQISHAFGHALGLTDRVAIPRRKGVCLFKHRHTPEAEHVAASNNTPSTTDEAARPSMMATCVGPADMPTINDIKLAAEDIKTVRNIYCGASNCSNFGLPQSEIMP